MDHRTSSYVLLRRSLWKHTSTCCPLPEITAGNATITGNNPLALFDSGTALVSYLLEFSRLPPALTVVPRSYRPSGCRITVLHNHPRRQARNWRV